MRAEEERLDVYLKNLGRHLFGYRTAMNLVVSRKLSRPRDCRQYFLNLLIATSQLYLDYLFVLNDLSKLERISAKIRKGRRLTVDLHREAVLRERLRERLKSRACWSYFKPDNGFSERTGLHTFDDYLNSFSLHLPEIYEETLRVERAATTFRKNRSSSALADLAVGLQHLARNHISFGNFALEWAADESSWER